MKKKFFLGFIIILFILGFYKEANAESSNPSNVKYSVHIYGEYIEEGLFFEGPIMYEAFDVENKTFIHLKGTIDSYAMVCFSNIYLDKNDDRYYSDDKSTPMDNGGAELKGSFDLMLKNKGYKYMYFMDYISINEFSGMNVYSCRIKQINITNFKMDVYDEYFIVNYNDNINAFGNLYDVRDFSIFDITSFNKYYIEVYKDSYTNNYMVNGEYEVVYRIYDDYSNEDYLTLTINVLYDEEMSPSIRCDGIKDKYDVYNVTPFDDIKKCFYAYDSIDKDISKNISFNTNYDESKLECKEYYVEATIINSRGYGMAKRVKFEVADITAPTISKSQIKTTYHEILSEKDIIEQIGIDDYSSYKYEVISDLYTKSFDIVGIYSYQIAVEDKFSNAKTYEISIEVYDDIKPEIIAKNIKTTTLVLLSDNEILNNVVINEKNKYKVEIDKSEYEENYNIKGVYKVFIKVIDISGNEESASLEINVVSEAKIKYYNNNIIIFNDHSLSEAELISFLREISDNTYNDQMISEVTSNYFKTPFEVGIYEVNMKTKDANGTEYQEIYNIEVKEKEVENVDEKVSGGKRFLKSIKDFFELIMSFFALIFKFLF